MPPSERRALVIGCKGQDGQLLFERLAPSCDVLGLDVNELHAQGPVAERVAGEQEGRVDITDAASALGVVEAFAPDELYYLAARHHSSEEMPDDAREIHATIAVNLLAFVHVLDAVRRHASRCRVFYAGSSHMFGRTQAQTQNESTPFHPENPYAISKVAGAHAAALFRARHETHVSVGILYNHESPLRPPHFVSQRIVQGAKRAAQDASFKLALGSLDAVVDWGYAPDYVDAMTRIVRQDAPDDYVIATGIPHTVQEFVELAFGAVGVDWRAHVVVDPGRVQAVAKAGALVGDASKLRARTGWKPSVSFAEMVARLVAAAT